MMPSPVSGSSPSPAPGAGRRIESLDAFRGTCALAVFLTHWLLWANFRPVGEAERLLHDCLDTVYQLFCYITWNSNGHHPAVLGFFVLSGFCIHASRARRGADGITGPDWRRYFSSRARRILPVYWWGTLLGLGLMALLATWPSNNPLLAAHVTGGWRDLLVRLFAVTAVVPGDVILGNWSLNTVSSEIAIYALYPLLYIGTRRIRWLPLLAGLIGLQFVALALLPYFPMHWIFGTPLMMGAYWYLGLLAAEWHFKGGGPVPAWVLLPVWGLFLALRDLPYSPVNFVLVQMLRALGFTVLLLWLVGREARSPAFVGHWPLRFLRWVGQGSYSLYAVHPPVIMATTWALGNLTGIRSNALQLLFTLLTTLLVTLLTYWFVERPYLRSVQVASVPKGA
jgi:peptidoglycan/LPS O-acetylase OafA/YrhL